MAAAAAVARRYSTALIGLGKKDNTHDTIAANLDAVVAALASHADVAETLANPAVDAGAKRKILESIAKSLSLQQVTTNFLLYLSDRQRFDVLEAIAADFRVQLDEIAGRIRAEVVTATPLAAGDQGKIQAALEQASGKKVVLQANVDPELVGGVVTKVGNIVLDGSVRTALGRMKAQLLDAVQ